MTTVYDHFDGPPCANCESRPQAPDSLFCDSECQDEYEGTGDFAEHEDFERYDIDTVRDTQEV